MKEESLIGSIPEKDLECVYLRVKKMVDSGTDNGAGEKPEKGKVIVKGKAARPLTVAGQVGEDPVSLATSPTGKAVTGKGTATQEVPSQMAATKKVSPLGTVSHERAII